MKISAGGTTYDAPLNYSLAGQVVGILPSGVPPGAATMMLKHLPTSTNCRQSNVLIVSSSDAPQDRHAVETSGVAGYFRKPSSYEEYMKLGPLIRTLLDTDATTDTTKTGVS